MINRKNRIIFTILSGALLVAGLLAGGAMTSNAQTTPEFSGKWNTVTSKGKKIVVVLKSTDRRAVVNGTYAINALSMAGYSDPDDSVEAFAFINASMSSNTTPVQSMSSIRGTVTGNVLRFKWIEDGGHGSGKFTMSADGRSFQGTFSNTDNPDDGSGGTWNGTRAPVFSGVWQMSGGPYPSTYMLIQEDGLAGHLVAGNPTMGIIKGGSVDGNTLRFTIFRPVPAGLERYQQEQYMGVAELTMAADGKSFSGKIFGVAATGTRIRR